MTRALDDVTAERRRQVEVEGFTAEHDDSYVNDQLASAAACYVMPKAWWMNTTFAALFDFIWPWDRRWLKRTDRRRDLVKAAALIIAEIERIDRASERKTNVGD